MPVFLRALGMVGEACKREVGEAIGSACLWCSSSSLSSSLLLLVMTMGKCLAGTSNRGSVASLGNRVLGPN
jgi:hypothetical protein